MLYPTTEEGKETMRIKDKHIVVSRIVQEFDQKTKSINVVHEKIELGVGVNAGIRGHKSRRNVSRSQRFDAKAVLKKMGKMMYADVDIDEMDMPSTRRNLGRRHMTTRRIKDLAVADVQPA